MTDLVYNSLIDEATRRSRSEAPAAYDRTREYAELVEPHVAEAVRICKAYGIPIIIAVSTKRDAESYEATRYKVTRGGWLPSALRACSDIIDRFFARTPHGVEYKGIDI